MAIGGYVRTTVWHVLRSSSSCRSPGSGRDGFRPSLAASYNTPGQGALTKKRCISSWSVFEQFGEKSHDQTDNYSEELEPYAPPSCTADFRVAPSPPPAYRQRQRARPSGLQRLQSLTMTRTAFHIRIQTQLENADKTLRTAYSSDIETDRREIAETPTRTTSDLSEGVHGTAAK